MNFTEHVSALSILSQALEAELPSPFVRLKTSPFEALSLPVTIREFGDSEYRIDSPDIAHAAMSYYLTHAQTSDPFCQWLDNLTEIEAEAILQIACYGYVRTFHA